MDPRAPAKGHQTPFKPKLKRYLATAAVANTAVDQTKVHTRAARASEDESGRQPLADYSVPDAAVANIDNSDDVENSLLFTVNNSLTDFCFDSPTGVFQRGDSSDTLCDPEDQTFVDQNFFDQSFVDQNLFDTSDHFLDHTFTDHEAVDQSSVHPLAFTDTTDTYTLAAEITSVIGQRSPSMESEVPSVGQDRDASKQSQEPKPKGVNEASAFISQLMHELRDRTHIVSAVLELLGLYHRKKIDETHLYIQVYSILYLNKCPPAIHEKFTTFLPRQWQLTDLEWLREGIRISLRTDAPRINAVQLEPPTITWSATPVQYRVLLAAMPMDVGGVAVQHVSSQQYAQQSQPYAASLAASRSHANSPGAAYLAMHNQAQQMQQPTPVTPHFPTLHHQMGDPYQQYPTHFGPQQVGAMSHYPQTQYMTHQATSMPDYRPSRPQEAVVTVPKNIFSQHRLGAQLSRPGAHTVPSEAATTTETRPRKKAPQIPREASPKTANVTKAHSGTAQAAISSFRNGPAHIAVKPQIGSRAPKRSRADREDSPRIEGTSILNIHTGGGRPPKRIRVPSDLSAHATSAFAALGGRSSGGRSSRGRSSAGVSANASRQDSPAEDVDNGARHEAEKDAEVADTTHLSGQ